jgi:peptidoglycan hydrolase-like protein with peptidoglycan-binding domain
METRFQSRQIQPPFAVFKSPRRIAFLRTTANTTSWNVDCSSIIEARTGKWPSLIAESGLRRRPELDLKPVNVHERHDGRRKTSARCRTQKGSLALATVFLSETIGVGVLPAWSQDPRTGPLVAGKIELRQVQSLEKAKEHNRMSAEKIKRVEEALQERLHDPGRIDGIIDHRTRVALREFQKLNNLPVTGVLDEQTAAKLGGVQPE